MISNFRVLRHIHVDLREYLAIHEVFYDQSGEPNFCTVKPVVPGSQTLSDLSDVLDLMKDALLKQVLDYDSIEKHD